MGTDDPDDLFLGGGGDLLEVGPGLKAPTRPRPQRARETFARIPHDKAVASYGRLNGAAWVLLVEIDRLIFKGGENPVRLSSPRLRGIGLRQHTRARALRELEAAGAVRILEHERGRAPLVLYCWLPPPS